MRIAIYRHFFFKLNSLFSSNSSVIAIRSQEGVCLDFTENIKKAIYHNISQYSEKLSQYIAITCFHYRDTPSMHS